MKTNQKDLIQGKKAILVDLDGTIVDTEKLDDIAMQITLKENNILSTKRIIGCTLEEYIQNVTEDKKLNQKIKAEFIQNYENLLKNSKLEINNQLLNILKKGSNLKIGLVTSNNKRLTAVILEKIGLKTFFDVIITCEDVKNNKPHPEPYLKALKKLNINPENCIAFEDTNEGLKSAESARINCKKIKF